jgi:hypothetical protein
VTSAGLQSISESDDGLDVTLITKPNEIVKLSTLGLFAFFLARKGGPFEGGEAAG